MNIKEVLRNTKMLLNSSIKDAYIWTNDLKGFYSAKSGCDWLLKRGEMVSSDLCWTWIWKIQAPENIKFLI